MWCMSSNPYFRFQRAVKIASVSHCFSTFFFFFLLYHQMQSCIVIVIVIIMIVDIIDSHPIYRNNRPAALFALFSLAHSFSSFWPFVLLICVSTHLRHHYCTNMECMFSDIIPRRKSRADGRRI